MQSSPNQPTKQIKVARRYLNTFRYCNIIMITTIIYEISTDIVKTCTVHTESERERAAHTHTRWAGYGRWNALNHNTNICQCWPTAFLRVSVYMDWLRFYRIFYVPLLLLFFIRLDRFTFFLGSPAQLQSKATNKKRRLFQVVHFFFFKGTDSFVVILTAHHAKGDLDFSFLFFPLLFCICTVLGISSIWNSFPGSFHITTEKCV